MFCLTVTNQSIKSNEERNNRQNKQDKSEATKIDTKNIFDSHCHMDRVFYKLFGTVKGDFFDVDAFTYRFGNYGPLEVLKYYFKSKFTANFEGIINVITDPYFFHEKYWNWIALESNVYLALGCHPSDVHHYDEKADYELEQGEILLLLYCYCPKLVRK